MCKVLKFEFLEIEDLVDDWDIRCRVALKDSVQVVTVNNCCEFQVNKIQLNEIIHIVVQYNNIVLGSQAVMIGKAFTEEISELSYKLKIKHPAPEANPQPLQVSYKLQLSSPNPLPPDSPSTQEPAPSLVCHLEAVQSPYIPSQANPSPSPSASLPPLPQQIQSKSSNLKASKPNKTDKSANTSKPAPDSITLKELNLGKVLQDSEEIQTGSKSYRRQNDCEYLDRIMRIEEQIKHGLDRTDYFKKILGRDFDKLVFEARCRESRNQSRSPTRGGSQGSGKTTPVISQKSLNASLISISRTCDKDLFELPSCVQVAIDGLSIENLDVLAQCVLGMTVKNLNYKESLKEIGPCVQMIKNQEGCKALLENACKASIHESETEYLNLDLLLNQIKEQISIAKEKITHTRDRTNMAEYEKNKLEKRLDELLVIKQESLSINQELITEIKSLSEANLKLESFRVETEEKLVDSIVTYKNELDKSNEELKLIIQDKNSIHSEVLSSSNECEIIESENLKLSKELQLISKQEDFDSDLNEILSDLQCYSTENFQSVESLKSKLVNLRSDKLETNTDTQSLIIKQEKNSRSLSNSSNSLQKTIAEQQETLTDLRKKLKPISQDLNQLEEMYQKKENIEESLQAQLLKLNFHQKISKSIEDEVNYFSDFIFSTSQHILQHSRILESIKLMLESKNIEFQALKDALSDIKSSNPVYIPIEGDYLDQAIGEFLNKRDSVIPVPFKRDSYGVYFFGSKKIMIKIEREKIIVRTGGGFLPIEQFIDTYLVSELDKQFKASDLKELDKFEKYKCETPILEEDV